MTPTPESTAITSPAELRELLGAPLRRAIDKDRRRFMNILAGRQVGLFLPVPGRGERRR